MKPRPRQANTQVNLFNDFFSNAAPKQSTQIKQSPRKPSQRSSFDKHDPFQEFSSPQKPVPPPKPVVEELIEEDEDFAPAATEMRKRLAAKGTQNTVAVSDESDAGSATKNVPSKGKGKKRAAPEDDEVVLAARERKRLALEQSRVAAEELAAAVKDHESLRNLGEVEVFSVDLSVQPPVRAGTSTRWNPAWNGRKNFKKFRRAKQSITAGVGREMIRLVDYNGKTAASQGIL
jgi:nibrin